MYFIYILHSSKANKFYIGYSPNPFKRLKEHNAYTDKAKFTAKYQPWVLKCSFVVSEHISDALKVERFIKKQKSKVFIEKLIKNHLDKNFIDSIITKAIAKSGPDSSGLIRRS
nr:GIY-YIG nuclease family protein [uncultured Carboxylicivirga sp.]